MGLCWSIRAGPGEYQDRPRTLPVPLGRGVLGRAAPAGARGGRGLTPPLERVGSLGDELSVRDLSRVQGGGPKGRRAELWVRADRRKPVENEIKVPHTGTQGRQGSSCCPLKFFNFMH